MLDQKKRSNVLMVLSLGLMVLVTLSNFSPSMTSLIVKAAPENLVIYDDQANFWNKSSGGTGNIEVAIATETSTVQSGTSKLKYQVLSGTKSWINIQHYYSTPQNWSAYSYFTFWWYGQNTGRTFTMTIEGPDYSNRFSKSFTDNFVGWKKIVVPYSDFIKLGSPSWSNVRKILITYDTATQQTWYIDLMAIETLDTPNYTLTINTVGQGSVTKNPSQTMYTPGAIVQLTAKPAAGQSFSGWSGALTGSANPATLTMNSNKAVTATFTSNPSATSKLPQQISLYGAPSTDTVKRYSYAIINYYQTAAQVAAMKAINPNLKLYLYRNFEHIYTTSPEYAYFASNNMLLKRADGTRIFYKDYPTTDVAVDMGNPLYRAFMKQWIRDNVIAKGYDGVFMDNFVRPTYSPSWSMDRGINPRTGALYTDAGWFNDEMLVLKEIKTTGVKAVGNGMTQADGLYGYWTNKARCDQVLAVQDGFMIEGPIAWGLADFKSRSATVWKQNIDLVKLLLDGGKTVMFSNTEAPDLETEAISRFVYCSYMMAGPASNYSLKFRGATFMSGAYWTNLVNLDLGTPLGSMVLEGSDYVRRFTRGTIRVNPTAKTSSVTLNS